MRAFERENPNAQANPRSASVGRFTAAHVSVQAPEDLRGCGPEPPVESRQFAYGEARVQGGSLQNRSRLSAARYIALDRSQHAQERCEAVNAPTRRRVSEMAGSRHVELPAPSNAFKFDERAQHHVRVLSRKDALDQGAKGGTSPTQRQRNRCAS